MPILRFVAEGVGPFDRIDLDLSDGKGNPHLGPHILAGVNGSGKSTVLRAIAWAFGQVKQWGFDAADWEHSTRGYPRSRAFIAMKPADNIIWTTACDRQSDANGDLANWAKRYRAQYGNLPRKPVPPEIVEYLGGTWLYQSTSQQFEKAAFHVSTYKSKPTLRSLNRPVDPRVTLQYSQERSLGFEHTVENEVVQSWIVQLFTQRAVAKDKGLDDTPFAELLGRLEGGLAMLLGQSVKVDIDLARYEPQFEIGGKLQDPSQLPDGAKAVIGWFADYLRRQEHIKEWDARLGGRRPGVLMLDEADAHLHPQWQRRLLPALREALPETQIIVTTHSPFIITSCPGARVHLLDLDERGKAHLVRSEEAPFGENILGTMRGIFGVESRFDLQTELELKEWFGLKKRTMAGSLEKEQKARMKTLETTLSKRSPELSLLVKGPEKVRARR